MYILLNRKNVLVDILPEARYIKLQSANGIVVACAEAEGTGVIGSDCDTHYTLIRADIQHDENAVRVMQIDELPDNCNPNHSIYNPETGEFSDYEPVNLYDALCEMDAQYAEQLATLEDALCELDKEE